MKFAITYGEPQGIGPELIGTIFSAEGPLLDPKNWVLFGDPQVSPQSLSSGLEIVGSTNNLQAGEHSFACTKMAAESCMNGQCKGLVTGPIDKSKWCDAGHSYAGVTELLAELLDCAPEMLFVARDWRTVLLTRHIPLSSVPNQITEMRLERVCTTLRGFLREFCNLSEPKLALAGLNPHGGDGGCIGTEELEWRSWLDRLRICGPHSPDAIWSKAARYYLCNQEQPYDAYIAPYHDQVLPLIKAVTNLSAVNVTIGLPFVRTAPDHGTAYDLSGTGTADHRPLLAAMQMCINLSVGRK